MCWSTRTRPIHPANPLVHPLLARLLAVLPTAPADDTSGRERQVVPGARCFPAGEDEVLRRTDEVVSRALLQAAEVSGAQSVDVQAGEVQTVLGPLAQEVRAHLQYFEEIGKGDGGWTARSKYKCEYEQYAYCFANILLMDFQNLKINVYGCNRISRCHIFHQLSRMLHGHSKIIPANAHKVRLDHYDVCTCHMRLFQLYASWR